MVAHAVTTVTVPTEREVAFAYQCGTEVDVSVDGGAVAADVTGHGPASLFDLHPVRRRTGVVRLRPGTSTLAVRVVKTAGLPDIEWYLSMSVIDPVDGREVVDVVVDAGPRPAWPPSPGAATGRD
jgi:hypothetical protein